MINFDKILGGLVSSVISGAVSPVVSKRTSKNLGRAAAKQFNLLDKKKLGVGALGIALAAYEHFTASTKETAARISNTVPPPVPENQPPPPPPPAIDHHEKDSVFLLRAMIAAANSDGIISAEERGVILKELQKGGLTSDESNYLEQELASPKSLSQLISEIPSRNIAEQTYLVSALVIQSASPDEAQYLQDLKVMLELSDEVVLSMHTQIGN